MLVPLPRRLAHLTLLHTNGLGELGIMNKTIQGMISTLLLSAFDGIRHVSSTVKESKALRRLSHLRLEDGHIAR